jgi:hypothetical protein
MNYRYRNGKISNDHQKEKSMTRKHRIKINQITTKRINKQCVVVLIFVFAMLGCAGTDRSVHTSQQVIISELEAQARQINSYGQEYRIRGMLVKRMYFQFEKDGQPFYRFREDLTRAGKRYIYIYNADGQHDYHYYPDEKKAYRSLTNGAWNESNYDKARDWHFDYDDARIIGEEVIRGKSCYLLEMQGSIFAVDKEKGIKLLKMDLSRDISQALYYENIEFDLKDDVFGIPPDVQVIDRK